jgi:hypothetical protein
MASANQLDDATRIQKLLDELKHSKTEAGGGSNGAKASGQPPSKALEMEPAAQMLLMEYVNEITCAILEEAACVASHRNSTEIDAADVNLVLAKKFAIEIPGAPRIKSLHKHAYKSSWPTITMGASVHDTASRVAAAQIAEKGSSVPVEAAKAPSQKRKIDEVDINIINGSDNEN